MIRRGTTPTLTVTVDADLTEAEPIELTVASGCSKIKLKPGPVTYDGEVSTLEFVPTQANTLYLKATESAQVQLRWLVGQTAFASDVATVQIGDVLDGVVLT